MLEETKAENLIPYHIDGPTLKKKEKRVKNAAINEEIIFSGCQTEKNLIGLLSI